MLTQSVGPEDQTHRAEALVRRWLQDRQSLIVLMRALSDEDQRPLDAASLSGHVQAFCEVLMDYVSAGHFEVYDELLAEAEQRHSDNLATGLALHARLQATTDVVIRFNDLYEDPENEGVLATLTPELAGLRLALENRFDIEDRMIALLHERTGTTTA